MTIKHIFQTLCCIHPFKSFLRVCFLVEIAREEPNVSSKESSLASSTLVEGLVIFPVGCSIRIVRRIIANSGRGSPDIEQVVFLVKVPAYSQVK
uniref:Uncharacterized protein n=1 Tax=Salix viminalis TaxID=40686 RepID=A0A6N2LV42_SALVM